MIDLVRIQIPIRTEFMIEHYDRESGRLTGGECDVAMFAKYGCSLAAGNVDFRDGETTVSRLYHPFESIPSSNSSLAYKIRAGGMNYFPHVELNASPAKLLTGHNAFGTADFEKCISALMYVFYTAFPKISDFLDYQLAEVTQMDFTYSAHVENLFVAKQIIQALRHVSAGQIRTSKETYETSVLWNAGSTHCVREVYLKHFEIKRQIEQLTKKQKQSPKDYQSFQLQMLQSESVQAFSQNAVRFEAKCKKRMFKRLGIPTLVNKLLTYEQSFNGDLAQMMWTESFREILSTFEGADVNVYDDEEVLKTLKAKYNTTNKDGKLNFTKALRIFRFFRSIKNEGFESVKSTTPKQTFYRNLAQLTDVVPRAQLQNMHTIKSNAVPLIRLVNVDFAKQHPAGYIEPLHMSQQLDSGLTQPLRLVG